MAQRKPSTGSKIVLSLGLIIVSIAYSLWQYVRGQQPITTTTTEQPTSIQITPATQTPAPQKEGLYSDGSYTGSPADAYYGMVQVRAIIKNGKVADVQFLQHPDSHETSRYINGQAMPMLTQEAIVAQNANVDSISGATQTSLAFQQSLASALAKAK